MPRPKPTPERKSRSGSYVHEAQRGGKGGHEERVTIRCSADLVARVRRVAREHGRTLAEVLEAGAEATERRPLVSTMTALEDERACRADALYERMRDNDR